MKTCPRCNEELADEVRKCRSCGALAIAPPTPAARPTPPPEAETLANEVPVAEQFFAPVALHTQLSASPPSASVTAKSTQPRLTRVPLAAMVALLVVVGVGAAVYAFHGGSHGKKTPVVLAAHAPTAGLPHSLEDVVRQQAESSRQTALAAIAQVSPAGGATLDPHQLEQVQPSLTWVPADQSSTGPNQVSMAQSDGHVTIAIAASSRDVCAFAVWSPGAASRYVTMGNVSSCRAVDAPSSGWSTLAGGSASDLPAEGY